MKGISITLQLQCVCVCRSFGSGGFELWTPTEYYYILCLFLNVTSVDGINKACCLTNIQQLNTDPPVSVAVEEVKSLEAQSPRR